MRRAARIFATLLFLYGVACDSESPTATSLTAPVVESPAPGEVLAQNPPTLTVRNASGGVGEPTYSFEVATDGAFGDVVASVEGVGQGDSGV